MRKKVTSVARTPRPHCTAVVPISINRNVRARAPRPDGPRWPRSKAVAASAVVSMPAKGFQLPSEEPVGRTCSREWLPR